MVRALFIDRKFSESFLTQGRILVAILALLGASRVSAEQVTETRESITRSAWKLTEPMKLPQVSITMGPAYVNPTYYMTLPNGEVIDLPTRVPVDVSGLTIEDQRSAAENARVILEGLARLVSSKTNSSFAVVRGPYAVAVVPDQQWLRGRGLKAFDPVAVALDVDSFGAAEIEVVDATGAAPESLFADETIAKGPQSPRDRLRSVYTFFRDAIYTSTIKAFKNHRASNHELKNQVQEWGIQIALRGELQLGIGKKSFTRNIPFMFSIGYNREKRTIVFRRGYRTETMADGVGMLAGTKIEFRRYRLFSDGADAADPRPNFSKLKGQSWYPPSIPVFSPVADWAPGYQSEGFALGFSIQNLVLPQTLLLDIPFALMNTVTSFEETQRVYSAAVPNPSAWMRRFHEQLTTSGAFAGPSAVVRCEGLFRPMPQRRVARRA